MTLMFSQLGHCIVCESLSWPPPCLHRYRSSRSEAVSASVLLVCFPGIVSWIVK